MQRVVLLNITYLRNFTNVANIIIQNLTDNSKDQNKLRNTTRQHSFKNNNRSKIIALISGSHKTKGN